MWHDMGFGAMMWYGWIFWIIIIGIVAYLVVKLANRGSAGSNNQTNETPLDILKKRYARGDISKEEYESRKKDLI